MTRARVRTRSSTARTAGTFNIEALSDDLVRLVVAKLPLTSLASLTSCSHGWHRGWFSELRDAVLSIADSSSKSRNKDAETRAAWRALSPAYSARFLRAGCSHVLDDGDEDSHHFCSHSICVHLLSRMMEDWKLCLDARLVGELLCHPEHVVQHYGLDGLERLHSKEQTETVLRVVDALLGSTDMGLQSSGLAALSVCIRDSKGSLDPRIADYTTKVAELLDAHVSVAYQQADRCWPGRGLWEVALDVLKLLPEWAGECEASNSLHCLRRILLSNSLLGCYLSTTQADIERHVTSLVNCSSGRKEQYLQSALEAVLAALRQLIATARDERNEQQAISWGGRVIKCSEVFNALLDVPVVRDRADAAGECLALAAQVSSLASEIRPVLDAHYERE